MGLARAAGLPVLVVGDIDRGGVFASLFGTLALLEPADQALIAGFVINKFRGDGSILAPGLKDLHARTGRPVLGVLPFVEDLWMDVEDSLALEARAPEAPAAAGGDTLDVAVLRLRWMSNFTDVDALGSEPGVRVRFTRSPADVERADLVVIPGTKATVEDLARLRAAGLDRALAGAGGGGRADPRDLRRLPDARPADRRRRSSPSSRTRSTGSACCRCARSSSADKILRRRAGRLRVARRRAHDDAATRSATAACCARPASRCCATTTASPTAAATAGRWAPRGTARWRTIRCGARCSSPSAPRAGGPSSRGRARSPPQRERRLDALGDLVEHHSTPTPCSRCWNTARRPICLPSKLLPEVHA